MNMVWVFVDYVHLDEAVSSSSEKWQGSRKGKQNQVLVGLSKDFWIWHASCFISGLYDLETGRPERLNTGAFVWAGQSSNPGERVFIKALSPILHPTRNPIPRVFRSTPSRANASTVRTAGAFDVQGSVEDI